MPIEQFGPQGELELPLPDRFLIIPLIIRLHEIPTAADGQPSTRITPDHVIDFYQAIEQFTGEFASALRAS